MSNYLIITGGSRGIGEKTIACFIQNGWQAINISRKPCDLPQVINISIDLSSSANVQKNAEKLQACIKEKGIISLVHNAAFYKRDSLDSLSLLDLQHTLETNVISPIALNQIFIPYMKPGSSIIYIGSTLSEKAVPGSASYVISKHALIGLMRTTCQDLIGKDIRTCCICPGLVDTTILRETMDESTINMLIDSKIIGKRLIEPQEIADVIHFCATSTVMNGSTIHANLGHIAD